MAKKGDWVRVHNVVLKASDRTAKIPEDTQKCDLEMWVKGVLMDETAKIGDTVTVETATGRLETGEILEEAPYYDHSYGTFIPEIIEIDKTLRKLTFGGKE